MKLILELKRKGVFHRTPTQSQLVDVVADLCIENDREILPRLQENPNDSEALENLYSVLRDGKKIIVKRAMGYNPIKICKRITEMGYVISKIDTYQERGLVKT